MSQVGAQLAAELSDQPHMPLKPHQVENLQEEKARLDEVMEAPKWVQVNKKLAGDALRRVNKTLNDQAPKELSPMRRDKVAKMVQELETEIQSCLQADTIMRRNPSGAVGRFQRGEGSKEMKSHILTWKRGLRALDPTNADPDYTSVERLRPNGFNVNGTSTFMADAQIPGKFAMTPLAKEQWPLGEPTANTALKQVVKRERTEAQKAAIAKAQAARRAKKSPPVA